MRPLALLAAGLFAGGLLADDKKDEKIDPTKLVGKWKVTRDILGKAPGVPRTVEFTKEGGVIFTSGEGKDAIEREGVYRIVRSAVLIECRAGIQKEKHLLDVVKLTDTELHLRPASDEKSRATEHERVKDEKKDK